MRFTPWLDRLKKSPKQRRHRKRSRSRAAESLEQRTLLTALVVTTETDALAAVDHDLHAASLETKEAPASLETKEVPASLETKEAPVPLETA